MISGPDGQTSHQRIKQELLHRFRSLPLESQLPSDRTLAAEFGVAFLTINRVMRELEAEGYVERRQRRGTFLAARERSVFKNPGEGNAAGGTIVFAYPNYFSYHYWQRQTYMEKAAHRAGVALAEYKTNSGGTCEQLCDFVRNRSDVRGLVVTPVPGAINRETLKLLDRLNLPVVILEPNDSVPLFKNLHVVTPDWRKSGYLKAATLLEAGHRDLAYLANEPDSPERPLVLKGMRQAVRDYKLPTRALQVIEHNTPPWQNSRQRCMELAVQTLRAGKTALIFDSFNGAKGGVLAAYRLGLRVPEQVSLIASGIGGGEEDFMVPPLTGVEYDVEREMSLAQEIVLGQPATSARTHILDVFLQRRESVAAPAPDRNAPAERAI